MQQFHSGTQVLSNSLYVYDVTILFLKSKRYLTEDLQCEYFWSDFPRSFWFGQSKEN